MASKTRVLFLIPSLVAHGAERQLCELVRYMDPNRFEVHVVVFYDPGTYIGGELGPEIADLPHVTLHSLHKRRGPAGFLTAFPRLLALVLRTKPHILHGYMDGNLPVLGAGWLLRKRIVWGIRRSSSDLTKLNRRALRLGAVMARLSKHVDLILFNSEAGRANYSKAGMHGRRAHVIPNGFDIQRFAPDPDAGALQRQAWGVPPDVPLIGIVGRFAPVKDHPTFLRAAARLHQAWPEARFVCVGNGPADYTETLKQQAENLGLGDRVLWPGVCDRMPAAYNALSLLILSSTDEGFPNVVGEAMACGIPCVTTRVGDAALLVGETGAVTAPADDVALAAAASALLGETPEARAERSRAARSRICSTFSVQALARNTEDMLLSLLPGPQTAALDRAGEN
ncbi:glycosyltransferase [Geothrix sp. PMB-07]|uniref:glycosyltransferase n=1 Tax=Geothrix sp. PMB-07 TaxID=3068640 RepID=UPI002741698E|nr:glycosyltransferase [Geothrix sp. PMB-07]WLT30006.1 glycosyltransferase [Geothrix sp. PMB-07]